MFMMTPPPPPLPPRAPLDQELRHLSEADRRRVKERYGKELDLWTARMAAHRARRDAEMEKIEWIFAAAIVFIAVAVVAMLGTIATAIYMSAGITGIVIAVTSLLVFAVAVVEVKRRM